MKKLLFLFVIAGLSISCGTMLAAGQVAVSALKFDCTKEQDPFAAYCEDLNQFLADASANKNAAGKVDRNNSRIKSDLRNIVFVYGSPDRFTSLLAPGIALRGAINSLPLSPNNSVASLAVISGVNQNRPDQQTGPNSNASGTTSLVQKAGAPAILAFALESGALTRTINGNTGTLSGNADGLFRALTGKQVLCFDCKGALGAPVLRDLNLSATFLISQSSATSVATSGAANSSTPASVTNVLIPTTAGKLSSLTARYQFSNPYDPHSKQFLESWQNAVTQSNAEITTLSTALQNSLVNLVKENRLDNDTKFQELAAVYFNTTFYDDVDAGNLDKLRQDFLTLYNTTVNTWINDDPEFNQKVLEANLALAQYKALWLKLLEQAKGQPLFTFEYNFNRPQSQPETHDFRFIYGYAPKQTIGLFSLNAAISIYGGTIPNGAKYGRLHDGQISAQYDRPISMGTNPNQATFSLAAYWQYQPDPSVLNITAGNLAPGTNIQLPQDAQVLLGTAGSLWVTQAKLTINGKSGIKIPIAVKWSNKTDLLTDSHRWGAQVGISYDFSSLSSLFGGSGNGP